MIRTRTAYATFEETVINLYNKQLLTLSLLDTLACMYRGMSVDSAGSHMLIANDGRDIQQICIGLVDPTFDIAERGAANDDDEYWEKELEVWSLITHTRWGWH